MICLNSCMFLQMTVAHPAVHVCPNLSIPNLLSITLILTTPDLLLKELPISSHYIHQPQLSDTRTIISVSSYRL